MSSELAAWAVTMAGPEDLDLVRSARERATVRFRWPDLGLLRAWCRQHGWPAPRFGLQESFIGSILASQENFALALNSSGIYIQVPKRTYALPAETLASFDALYANRSAEGRPTDWGILVEDLRDLRRAVEAGVVVTVEEGSRLQSWQDFYTWAHGRYHMLEDGYDRWIGDDA